MENRRLYVCAPDLRGLIRRGAATMFLAFSVVGCATPPTVPAPSPPVAAPQPAQEQPTFTEIGVASWYGANHQGRATASGETFDMKKLTAAHRTLPLDTVARVTSLATGRSVKVRINDRGPYIRGRVVDLSAEAAQELGIARAGIAKVKIEVFASDQRQPVADAGGGPD